METENKVLTGILLTILGFTIVGDLRHRPTCECGVCKSRREVTGQ